MEGLTLFKSIGELYSDYQAYFKNRTNLLVHLVSITILLITLFSMLAVVPMGGKAKFALLYPHAGMGILITCVCVYLSQEIVAGTLGVFIVIVYYVCGNLLYFGLGSYHMKIVATLHIAAWVAGMISTAYYERRKPTLPQELTIAIAIPLCFSVDIVSFLGYKPPFVTKYGKRE